MTRLRTTAALLATALLAAALAAPAPVQAGDASTITCADLASMGKDDITALLFWIDGYMGGHAGDATFDMDRLSANIDGAMAICEQNPDSTLMDALYTAENG